MGNPMKLFENTENTEGEAVNACKEIGFNNTRTGDMALMAIVQKVATQNGWTATKTLRTFVRAGVAAYDSLMHVEGKFTRTGKR